MFYYFFSREQMNWDLDSLGAVHTNKDFSFAFTEITRSPRSTWEDAILVAASKTELGVTEFTSEAIVP